MIRSVYLAGPMSGNKDWNFPAFHEAAQDLRERGYTVFSPAEMEDSQALSHLDPLNKAAAHKDISWAHNLRRDLIVITQLVDAVVVLEGWEESKGACLETHVAFELGTPVLEFPFLTPIENSKRLEALHKIIERCASEPAIV